MFCFLQIQQLNSSLFSWLFLVFQPIYFILKGKGKERKGKSPGLFTKAQRPVHDSENSRILNFFSSDTNPVLACYTLKVLLFDLCNCPTDLWKMNEMKKLHSTQKKICHLSICFSQRGGLSTEMFLWCCLRCFWRKGKSFFGGTKPHLFADKL